MILSLTIPLPRPRMDTIGAGMQPLLSPITCLSPEANQKQNQIHSGVKNLVVLSVLTVIVQDSRKTVLKDQGIALWSGNRNPASREQGTFSPSLG